MRSGVFDRTVLEAPCPDGFVKVTEGSTAVLFPPAIVSKNKLNIEQDKETSLNDQNDQAVFYNPAQVVNRDLSVCAIELFARKRVKESNRRGAGAKNGITILEALSATGLRAIRYYKEINNIKYIIANDLDADAVECIARNCAYNDVPVALPSLESNFDESTLTLRPGNASAEEERTVEEPYKSMIEKGGVIIPNLDDAVDLMHRLAVNPDVRPGERMVKVSNTTTTTSTSAPTFTPLLQQELMDVVDLDPYGTASPFLDGAMRCIKEGGLLLVTSTDSPVLCGNFPDTCHAKYNSISYKGHHCHEMAVRMLLAAIERVANKHKKYIVPLFSCHIDFYVRCFVRVYTQAAEVKLSPCKLGYQLQCTHCPAFWVRAMAKSRPPRDRQRKMHNKEYKKKRERAEGEEKNEEAEDTKANGMTADAAGHHHQEPKGEEYPPIPDRQTNPKVTATLLKDVLGPSADGACPVCGAAVALSGPLYCGPTQHREFLAELMQVVEEREREGKITATARILGLLRLASEELPQSPLFYDLPEVASFIKVRCPTTPLFVGALGRLGYQCSQVHCSGAGLKTSCPPEVLFRVMLAWKKKCDTEDGVETTGTEMASNPTKLTPLVEADFGYDKKYDFRRQATGVAKFVPNAPGWGPKRRHQGAQHEEEEKE